MAANLITCFLRISYLKALKKGNSQNGKAKKPVFCNHQNLTDAERIEQLTDLIAGIVVEQVFKQIEESKIEEKIDRDIVLD